MSSIFLGILRVPGRHRRCVSPMPRRLRGGKSWRSAFNINNVVTYEFKESVGIPLRKQPIVLSSTFFPLAQYVNVTEKRYLYRAVDTCLWNGVRCIYKQLQFDSMMATLNREIETRETLLHYFGFGAKGTEPSPSLLSDRGINPSWLTVATLYYSTESCSCMRARV